jgi:hypothetical protein
MADRRATIVVTVRIHGNFTARQVKSNRDVAEVLLMASTYWRAWWAALRDFSAPWERTVNGVDVPAGYQHEVVLGTGAPRGRIWRKNGPDIAYELDGNAGNQAREYAERNRKAWMLTIEDSTVVTMDEARQTLIVSDSRVNFVGTGIKTRRDVAEMMLTALTSPSPGLKDPASCRGHQER